MYKKKKIYRSDRVKLGWVKAQYKKIKPKMSLTYLKNSYYYL